MKPNDDELDSMLKVFRQMEPSEQMLSRWRSTIVVSRRAWYFQLVAAVLVGCVLGAFLLLSFEAVRGPGGFSADNFGENATFAYTHTNLDSN